jgi:hypothetical protein
MGVMVLLGSVLCGHRMESIVRDHTADRPDSAAAMIELTIRTVDGSDTMDEGHMVLSRCKRVLFFSATKTLGKYDGIRKSKVSQGKARQRLVVSGSRRGFGCAVLCFVL